MFPRRFFAGDFFAPRYFPQSAGGAPAVVIGNMPMAQMGYLQASLRGLRSIVLLLLGA